MTDVQVCLQKKLGKKTKLSMGTTQGEQDRHYEVILNQWPGFDIMVTKSVKVASLGHDQWLPCSNGWEQLLHPMKGYKLQAAQSVLLKETQIKGWDEVYTMKPC